MMSSEHMKTVTVANLFLQIQILLQATLRARSYIFNHLSVWLVTDGHAKQKFSYQPFFPIHHAIVFIHVNVTVTNVNTIRLFALAASVQEMFTSFWIQIVFSQSDDAGSRA